MVGYTSTPTVADIGGSPQYTATEIKQLREYAKALKEKHKPWGNNPYYTWANGLDRVSGDIISGLFDRKADVLDRDLSGKDALANLYPGSNLGSLAPQYNTSTGTLPPNPNIPGPVSSRITDPVSSGPEGSSAAFSPPTPTPPSAILNPPIPPTRPVQLNAAARAAALPLEVPQDNKAANNLYSNWPKAPPGGGAGVDPFPETRVASLGQQPLQSMPQQQPIRTQDGPNPIGTMDGHPRIGSTNNIQLAQAQGKSPIQPMPQTRPGITPDMNWSAYYSNLVSGFLKNGHSLEEARKEAEGIVERQSKFAPQFGIDPNTGMVTRQQFGQPPQITGQAPGYPGTVSKFGDTDLSVQRRYDPTTGKFKEEIIVPHTPTIPKSEAAAPPPISQKLETPPINDGPKIQRSDTQIVPKKDIYKRIASLGDTVISASRGTLPQTAQVEIEKSIPGSKWVSGFNVSNPIEASGLDTIKKAIEEANKQPPLSIGKLGAPNLLDLAEKGDVGGILHQKSNQKAFENHLENKLNEESKEYGKYQASYRDAASQAVKLRPGLKQVIEIVKSPEFQSGPANKLIELGQGAREELGHLVDNLANDAVKRGEDPGIYKTLKDWALNPINREATANQVFTKIMSATTLQSLRGMLGPNSGQFRQYEMQLLRDALGNTSLTPAANLVVLNMIDKANDRNILLSKMADEYAQKRKGLDPTFEKYINAFEEQNPTYTNEEFRDLIKLGTYAPVEGGVLGTPAPAATPYKGGRKPAKIPGHEGFEIH